MNFLSVSAAGQRQKPLNTLFCLMNVLGMVGFDHDGEEFLQSLPLCPCSHAGPMTEPAVLISRSRMLSPSSSC